jgi:cell division protein FtsB
MTWLTKLLGGVLTNALSKLSVLIFDYFKVYFEQSERQKELNKMAEDVSSISAEIKKLISEGKEVPQELKDKLREAGKNLVDSSSISSE